MWSAVVENAKARPGSVDSQIARTTLPTSQDDQARAGLRFVHRMVNVSNNDEVDLASTGGGVLAIDDQMPFFVGGELTFVIPG